MATMNVHDTHVDTSQGIDARSTTLQGQVAALNNNYGPTFFMFDVHHRYGYVHGLTTTQVVSISP
jgi:hypothetical protein